MADVKVLNINGTSYNIKDETARNTANSAQSDATAAQSAATAAQSTANTAKSTAEAAQSAAVAAGEKAANGLKAEYDDASETITFSKIG